MFLATMGGHVTPAQNEIAREIPNLHLIQSDFKLEWMDSPWEDVQAAGEWLLPIESTVQPDIIHLNGYAHAALPWTAPVLVAGHSCVFSWFQAVKREQPPSSFHRYREEVKRGIQSADAVTAPTWTMLSFLEEHYGPFRSVGPIPNGRTAPALRPGTKAPFIMTAGRLWDEAKNVRALERVSDHVLWPIVVAGEGRHPNGDERRFKNVTLIGQLSEPQIRNWFQHASIFALPARYESSGYVHWKPLRRAARLSWETSPA